MQVITLQAFQDFLLEQFYSIFKKVQPENEMPEV